MYTLRLGAFLDRVMGSSCVLEKLGVRPLDFLQESTEVNVLLKEFSINGAVYRSVEEYVIRVEDQARV